MKKHLIKLVLPIILTSCISNLEVVGFVEEDVVHFQELEVNKDNKTKICQLLGEPTLISDFEPKNWYYINFVKNRTPFTKANVKNFHMLEIGFDEKGVINHKKIYTKEDLNKFNYEKNFISNKEVSEGKLDSLINNIGTLNPLKSNRKRR